MTKVDIQNIKDQLDKKGYDVFLYHSTLSEIDDPIFHGLRLNFIKSQNELENYLIEQANNLGVELYEESV